HANDGEDYACIHPISRKDNGRNGDKPNHGGVVRKFCKRTINITDYRDSKDKVNRPKNRAFGGITHDWLVNRFSGETKPNSIHFVHDARLDFDRALPNENSEPLAAEVQPIGNVVRENIG